MINKYSRNKYKIVQITYYLLLIIGITSLNCFAANSTASNDDIPTTPVSQKKLEDTIWQSLATQDVATINKLINRTTDPGILAWLTLAKVTNNTALSNPNQSNSILNKIAAWREEYPNHPAKMYFNELKHDLNYNKFSTKPNQKIAVLLPTTSSLKHTAKSITKGILTAFYQDSNTDKPELIFIDTHNNPNDIIKYYKEALDKNVDLIIGPLEKTAVVKLKDYVDSNSDNNPTIIALNYIPNTNDNLIDKSQNFNNNFYQIGISAEDEAEQAAIRSFNHNNTRALLLVDNNDWGKRIANSYTKKLKHLGGKIINTIYINNKNNPQFLVNDLASVLGINESQQRKNSLQNVIAEKLAFEPRHRQDIDHLFIMTSPYKAKQIKPLLKFYYADDLPVIATSHIYEYKTNNRESLRDLDGVWFCDIPLLIHNNKTTLTNSTNGNYDNLIRLYALGIDVYNLAYQINTLRMIPNIGLLANTGHLYIDSEGKIHRQLPWALIKNGNLHNEQITWS